MNNLIIFSYFSGNVWTLGLMIVMMKGRSKTYFFNVFRPRDGRNRRNIVDLFIISHLLLSANQRNCIRFSRATKYKHRNLMN